MSGYLDPIYASAFTEFGVPSELSQCGGWVLKRPIPSFSYYDAMGPYPLFSCKDWSKLAIDLEEIGQTLISLAVVTDPFGDYDLEFLHQAFRDVVYPFKEHFVIDLGRSRDSFVSEHHRRNARKAGKTVLVERCEAPLAYLNDWINLYANLAKRRQIKGMTAFSPDSFARQLQVPGITVFRASYEGITVGMLLWYIQGEIGYYHLGAYSDIGYELQASFALFWFAIEYFAAKNLCWLNLGAGAGVKSETMDGLSRFKRGWATGTRTAYFCGRIFDQARYLELTKAKGTLTTGYFPAYRMGEFR